MDWQALISLSSSHNNNEDDELSSIDFLSVGWHEISVSSKRNVMKKKKSVLRLVDTDTVILMGLLAQD